VEITIALGLVSFIAVSVVALLPTGLSVMRNAMDQTVEEQIVRSISVSNLGSGENGAG